MWSDYIYYFAKGFYPLLNNQKVSVQLMWILWFSIFTETLNEETCGVITCMILSFDIFRYHITTLPLPHYHYHIAINTFITITTINTLPLTHYHYYIAITTSTLPSLYYYFTITRLWYVNGTLPSTTQCTCLILSNMIKVEYSHYIIEYDQSGVLPLPVNMMFWITPTTHL